MMAGAGIAWGVYSIRGKDNATPSLASLGNFLMTIPMVMGLVVVSAIGHGLTLDPIGIGYALASGSLASAVGYLIWYSILPELTAMNAATIQLSVPVIAAICGVWLLAEPLTLRMVLASLAILGGIALVIWQHKTP
jgi:drug/metabolite transporter (DMT)-like permease